ncbi:hypothetical protein ACOMHN_002846 [Nucella lapillus]
MALVKERKPRNVRSVYARPHNVQCEVVAQPDSQETLVSHTRSGSDHKSASTASRGKPDRGRRSDVKQSVESSTDDGLHCLRGRKTGKKLEENEGEAAMASQSPQGKGTVAAATPASRRRGRPSVAARNPLRKKASVRQDEEERKTEARSARHPVRKKSSRSPVRKKSSRSPVRKKSPDAKSSRNPARKKSSVQEEDERKCEAKSARSPVRKNPRAAAKSSVVEADEESSRGKTGSSVQKGSSVDQTEWSSSTRQTFVSKGSVVSRGILSRLKRKLEENKDTDAKLAQSAACEGGDQRVTTVVGEGEDRRITTDVGEGEDRRITTVKPYVCETCQRRYRSEASLRQHERVHLGEGGPGDIAVQFPENGAQAACCGVCCKVFVSKAALDKHRAVHTAVKPFVCDSCGKSFSQASNLNIHLLQHTGRRPFACDVCDKSYLRNFDLQQHKRLHTGEKPYVCMTCGKGFTKMDYLKTHRQVHTGLRPFLCDECPLSFRRNNQLKAHKRIHSGVKPFECEVCQKTFSTKGILKTHKFTHASKRSTVNCHVCDVCGMNLGRKSSLKTHMMTHSGERPFACETCGKGYITRQEWRVHCHSHTGARPFVCPLCPATYVRKANLRQHIRAVHWGCRPFCCAQCPKAFADRRTLRDHRLTHSGVRPFTCGQCGKGFTQAGALKAHGRVHTGERPFACPHCAKRFADLGCRNRHARIHTGERPYVCPHCPAAFPRLEACKQHVGTVHGEDPAAAQTATGIASPAPHSRSVAGERSLPDPASLPSAPCAELVVVVESAQTSEAGDGGGCEGGRVMVVEPGCGDNVSTVIMDGPLAGPTVVVESTQHQYAVECSHQYAVESTQHQYAVECTQHTQQGVKVEATGETSESGCVQVEWTEEGGCVSGGAGQQPMQADSGPGAHSSVVCRPVSSGHGHLPDSRPEVIEYVIIQQPADAQAQLDGSAPGGALLVDEGEVGSALGALQGAEVDVMPGIIEVQLLPSRQGRPPQIVEVKVDGELASCLTVEGHQRQAASLSTNQSSSLTASQAASLRNQASSLTTKQASSLTASQAASLRNQGSSLTTKQASSVTTKKASSVKTKQASSLTTKHLSALAMSQASLTTSQASLTSQASSLTPGHVEVAGGESDGQQKTEPAGPAAVRVQRADDQTTSTPTERESTTSCGHKGAALVGAGADCQGPAPRTACHTAATGTQSQLVHQNAADEVGDNCPKTCKSEKATVVSDNPDTQYQDEGCEAETGGKLGMVEPLPAEGDGNTVTLTVVGSEVADSDLDVASITVIEAPTDTPSNVIHIYQDDGAGNLTLIDSQTLEDGSSQLGSGVGPGLIDLQGVETIHIITTDTGNRDTPGRNHVASGHGDAGENDTSVADTKPSLDALDQKPVLPCVKRNANRRFNRKHQPPAVGVDAAVWQDAIKTSRRSAAKTHKDWICEVCGKGFTQRTSLKNHLSVQHGRGEGEGGKEHRCGTCGKVCVSRSMLAAHQRAHSGERPFPCALCPNTYKHKADLRQHIRAGHLGKRPHVCEACGKGFTEKRSLKDHRLIHAGVKPYVCPVCTKPFTQASSLHNHLRTHSGARPWVCPFCAKGFSDQSAFTRHQRIHTGEKPFVCDRCPAAFARSEQLKKHRSKDHAHNLQSLASVAAAVADQHSVETTSV